MFSKYFIITNKKGEIMIKIQNTSIRSIIKDYRLIWAIGHAQKLMGWDAETYMPKKGIEDRGEAEGILAKETQRLLLKDEFKKKIKEAKKEELNETEKGIIRIFDREITIMESLPPEFVEEFAKTTTKARMNWREAKEKNDFKLFQEHLQKIIDLNIKKAEYIGKHTLLYDNLLDLYEEGLTVKDMDKLFESIKEPLKKILQKVKDSPTFLEKHPLEDQEYDARKMDELNHKVLEKFKFDLGKGRLDISSHPFTEEISMNDVRITTWYPKTDFCRSLSATIHEFGHALYEMQVSPELERTPVAGGVSMGVHESQSRFWENLIGRNEEFVFRNFEMFKKHLPFLDKYEKEEVYRYFNNMRPSLIRVEADELTYHFHIMLRYELEKQMMKGKIEIKDMPLIWNEKMKEYLGIVPTTDSEGVLQDIHWSMGSIGYFPTYSLGTILASQIQNKMEKEIGGVNELIKEEKYTEIKEWLGERIHKYGSTYTPKELIKKVLGEDVNAKYFLEHIEKKVKEIY